MKLTSYYIQLYDRFHTEAGENPARVQVDEIAELLGCTHRNVLLILKRMTERGWIRWTPRRGRGNRSELVFLSQRDDLILESAKQMLEMKDLRGALEKIHMAALPETVKEQFHDWLFDHFGYRSEIQGNKKYDTLQFPLTQPFETLDPLRINFSVESHLVNQIFDSLVRYDSIDQQIKPHIAHAWESNANRRQWTFYLRKGVLFHHGRELTAEDVVFTLNRIRQSPVRSLYRWGFEQIEDIEIADPNTLRIRLFEPNELFLHLLSTNRSSIVPKEICEQDEERFARLPVGTGPFKLTSNNGSLCVLEVFPHYFQGRAHLDKVEIWNVPDLYEAKFTKRLEDFQIMHNVRIPEASSTVWNQVKQQGSVCKFITFNLTKPGPLLFPPLREALYQAINCSAVIEHIGGDAVHPTTGFVSANTGHTPPFNSAQAMSGLRQAGYRGETLELCTIRQYENDARIVQEVCEQVGVKLHIHLLSTDEFKGEQRLKADLLLFAVTLDDDLELRLIDLYKSMQQHLSNDVHAYIDGPLRQILKRSDKPARTSLFKEVEGFLKRRHALLFLYQKHLHTVYQPNVRGISLDSLGWVQFKNIWLTT